MLGFLFKDKKLERSAHNLFAQIIEHTRQPVFYTDYAVEDSLDGRFDLMAMHMSLVINKLDQSAQEQPVSDLKRMLQEAMFDNLDLAMREVGVGDLGVGKRVKEMAEAFYGRIKKYQEHLKLHDRSKLQEAIHRNLYRERETSPGILDGITDYYLEQWQNINEYDLSGVLAGNVRFNLPTGIESDE